MPRVTELFYIFYFWRFRKCDTFFESPNPMLTQPQGFKPEQFQRCCSLIWDNWQFWCPKIRALAPGNEKGI